MRISTIPCECTLHKFHNGSAYLHNCVMEDAYDVNLHVKHFHFKDVPLKERPRTVLISRSDDDFWIHVRYDLDGRWNLTGLVRDPNSKLDKYYSMYLVSYEKPLIAHEDIGMFLELKNWLDAIDAIKLKQKTEIQNAKKQMKEEYLRIKSLTNRSIRI